MPIRKLLTKNIFSLSSLFVIKFIKQFKRIGYSWIKAVICFSFKALPFVAPDEYFNLLAEVDLTVDDSLYDMQLEIIKCHQNCKVKERLWLKHYIRVDIEEINCISEVCFHLLDLFNNFISLYKPFQSVSLFQKLLDIRMFW